MLTTNELTDALALEAKGAPANLERLGQVHGRVAVRRRRRAAGAGLAAVGVLVAAVAVLPNLDSGSDRTLPVAPSPSVSGDVPLPEYHLGGRLIAQEEHTGGEAFAMQFIPSSAELMFTVDCSVPGEKNVDGIFLTSVELQLNGELVGRIGCSPDPVLTGANTFTPDLAAMGAVSPGFSSALRVTVLGAGPASSRVRVGVYAAVPVADYPFPAAPSPLPALEPYANVVAAGNPSTLALLSAGPLSPDVGSPEIVGARGTWSKTVTLKRGLRIEGQTVAPGTVTILVNGTSVDSFSGWDYVNAGWGNNLTLKKLGISSGDPVTVTVTAERFPGDSWVLLLADEAP